MAGKRRSGSVFFEKDLLLSPAYFRLTAKAPQTLGVFFTKRRVEKLRRPDKRGNTYSVTNNGEITFTYREAQEKFDLSMGQFRRAIDQLVEVGFIDIARPGNGLQRDATLYALSERWRKYGKPDFEARKRPRGRPWQTD